MGKSNAFKKIAVGAALAGAAGYVVGVLTAPNEGKKTRQQLKKTAENSVGDVEKQLKQLHSELGDLVADAKDGGSELSGRMQKKFGGAVDNARDAKDKLRQVLSSVHEGEASDKDLKKALEDARRSLNHLKQFIKK
ncbi:MAG: YtxH protein [Candidatus Saccharibacteria bacterium]|nr:YtxH protein [Candidatus Saccharibacteria bacterium]